MASSEAPGFYKKKPSERLKHVKAFADLSDEETEAISDYGALGKETANRMIENVVGTFPMPLGIAANFMINGKDYMVPMALEEPSVSAFMPKALSSMQPTSPHLIFPNLTSMCYTRMSALKAMPKP